MRQVKQSGSFFRECDLWEWLCFILGIPSN